MNQQEYEKRMKNPKYKDLKVTNCESNEEYVFISYCGNSWEKVLTEIVYRLQKIYHLRIYFDKDFAMETSVWIDQFAKNMDSPNCKAFLCFLDEGYVTSYATLLELMHAMNPKSKLDKAIFSINFPINWEKLSKYDANIGLGDLSQGNSACEEELNEFKREFEILINEKPKYGRIKAYFNPDKPELRACDCKDIMNILQPRNKRDYVDTREFYEQFIINPLKKVCPGVFAYERTGVSISEADNTIGWDVQNGNGDIVDSDIFQYRLWGEQHTAHKLAAMMHDVFELIAKKYPDKIEEMARDSSIISVATKEAVDNELLSSGKMNYFNAKKEHAVKGKVYYVATKYNREQGVGQLKKMLAICEGDSNAFVIDAMPRKAQKSVKQ